MEPRAVREDRVGSTRSSTKGRRCTPCGSSCSSPTGVRFGEKQEEEQVHQATCLNLLTNCVITWNTVYMAAAIDQLRQEGYAVQESDLAYLSPCRYEHINSYGKLRLRDKRVTPRRQTAPAPARPPPGLALFFVRLLRE